jgi:hypothetical protein
MLMSKRSTEEEYGTIICGTGPREEKLNVCESALRKSPMIIGWLQDLDSMPESLRKDGALYLPTYPPTVVRAVFDCLRSQAYNSECIKDPSGGDGQNAIFFVEMYKLSLFLRYGYVTPNNFIKESN